MVTNTNTSNLANHLQIKQIFVPCENQIYDTLLDTQHLYTASIMIWRRSLQVSEDEGPHTRTILYCTTIYKSTLIYTNRIFCS